MRSSNDEEENTPLLERENECPYPLSEVASMYIYVSDLKSIMDEEPPYNVSVVLFSVLATITGFLSGWDQGVLGGAILLLVDAFDLSTTGEAVVISAALFSAIAMVLFSGDLTDRFGRRTLILISYLLFTTGSALVCISMSFEVLVCGRIIIGLGLGIASSAVPLYISEVAPTRNRGALVTLFVLGHMFGVFVGSLAAGTVSGINEGWRWLFGFTLLLSVLLFFSFIALPESPRWLFSQGKYADAFLAFKIMRSNKLVAYNEIKNLIKMELVKGLDIAEMKILNDSNVENKISDYSSGGEGHMRERGFHAPRAFVLGSSLHICQQMLGLSAIGYFATQILRFVGFDQTSAIWLGVAINASKLTGAICGIFFVDRLGRRPLILYSVAVCAFSLVALACAYAYAMDLSTPVRVSSISDPSSVCNDYEQCVSCLSNKECGLCYEENYISCVGVKMINDTATSSQCPSSQIEVDECPGNLPNAASWLVFTSICLFSIALAPGIGPLPWTINSEIHPGEVRGSHVSMAAAINWTMNFTMCVSFLFLVNTIGGPILFSMYASTAAVFFIFFYVYLPETKNKTLESIGEAFENRWGKANNDDGVCFKTSMIVLNLLMMSLIIGVATAVTWIVLQP